MIAVSIIIINYNTETYTIKCIDSFIKQTSPALKCQYLVVDNASEKKSYQKLKDYIKHISSNLNIELIRSNINTGFGGGNMIGVQKAKGNYLAFVNNDVELEKDCLSSLKLFMDNHNQVGVCGPQAYNKQHKLLSTIDHFASLGRELFGRKFLEAINKKKYPKRNREYKNPVQAQFIAGSFMFFRAEDFYIIGGFDTNIFLYYEETDLCRRLKKINKTAFLVPNTSFIHYHGVSTKKSIAIKTELKISLLYVIRKHQGIIAFYILLTYLQIKYFFSSLVKPKYWPLFFVLLQQAPLTKSIKHKQKIVTI